MVSKGSKLSAETIAKLSESHKGRIAWNKGKTGIYSAETRAKISASKKGQISWKKGKTGIYSPETLAKMSASRVGKNLTVPKIELSSNSIGNIAFRKTKTHGINL